MEFVMEKGKPTVSEFKEQLESHFGQSLNSRADEAAEDFWNYWELFSNSVKNQDLNPLVDFLYLGINFPEYKRFHAYKGLGKILIVVGLITLFISWKIGVVILVIGFFANTYGDKKKRMDGQQFYDDLMSAITTNPNEQGFSKLCSYYIGGIVKLVTSNGEAVWPQHPSNAVTGDHTTIRNM